MDDLGRESAAIASAAIVLDWTQLTLLGDNQRTPSTREYKQHRWRGVQCFAGRSRVTGTTYQNPPLICSCRLVADGTRLVSETEESARAFESHQELGHISKPPRGVSG